MIHVDSSCVFIASRVPCLNFQKPKSQPVNFAGA